MVAALEGARRVMMEAGVPILGAWTSTTSTTSITIITGSIASSTSSISSNRSSRRTRGRALHHDGGRRAYLGCVDVGWMWG